MRIMVVGPLGADDFADNVGATLRRMGHEAITVGAPRLQIPIRRAARLGNILAEHMSDFDLRLQRNLLREISRVRPEVVLTMDRTLHRALIREAQSKGARVALWFPDAVATMGRHDMFINGYDRIYLKNPVLVRQLNDIQGLPVRYLPEACNSDWHRSEAEYGVDPHVVMAGNMHPTRSVLVDRLLQDGFPVKIYGARIPSWIGMPSIEAAHVNRYLARREKADVFRRARVVLNNLHPSEYAGINCRIFEATGSGALVLTEHREGLDALFSVGTELDCFGSYNELADKLSQYLGDRAKGLSIADAAAVRAHADHTYEHRLNSILEDLT